MKTTVNSVTLGTITYEESLWSGKKELFVNDEPLEKINKTQFRTQDGKTVTVKGNIVFGCLYMFFYFFRCRWRYNLLFLIRCTK